MDQWERECPCLWRRSPDAPEEDKCANGGEEGGADGGEAKVRDTQLVRSSEDAEWDVAGHRTRQQQDEEESSKCEEEPHVERDGQRLTLSILNCDIRQRSSV